jgi:RNA polymerase sigma-70 factor (ECF subfamily)
MAIPAVQGAVPCDNGQRTLNIPQPLGINLEPNPLMEHSKQDARELRAELLNALPRLRRFARSLTGNRHDGDDLMQSTVERVLDKGVPGNVELLRWMFKVCRNLWIDDRRAHQVRLRAHHEPELSEERVVSGETVALGELTLREVERALAALPEEQRSVLALVAVEGLSYREAADILETPIGTVMSRLARARAALAARLEPGATEAGR